MRLAQRNLALGGGMAALGLLLAISGGGMLYRGIGTSTDAAAELARRVQIASTKDCRAAFNRALPDAIIQESKDALTITRRRVDPENANAELLTSSTILLQCTGHTLKRYCYGMGCPSHGIEFELTPALQASPQD